MYLIKSHEIGVEDKWTFYFIETIRKRGSSYAGRIYILHLTYSGAAIYLSCVESNL